MLENKIIELQNKNRVIRKKFKNLLKGFEQYLPYPEASNLSSSKKAQLIFDKVKFTNIDEGDLGKTNFRKIAWFLRNVSNLALRKNHTRISEDDIRETTL